MGLGSGWLAMGLLLLLPMVGIGLSAIYFVLIGQQVTGTGYRPERLLVQAWRTWGRLLRFLLLLIGVSLLFGMPLMALALVLGPSSEVLSLAVTALWVALIWAQFYLFFLVDAMVISDVGPLQAMRNSMAIVRSHMSSTLGLVILVWIITLGMPVIWDRLAESGPGIVVSIFGNAYIMVGLAAASMIYYRDRIQTNRRA